MFLAWDAVDRAIELDAFYVLALAARNGFICVPKRNIPPESVAGFVELLNEHGYKIGTLGAASARVTPR